MTSVHRLDDPRIFQKECRTLAAAGYDVVLVGTGSSYTVDDGVRVKTVPLPATRLERMTRVLWRLYRLADAEAADIYHFHDPELLVMAWIMKARGRNVIFDAHEDLPAQILGKDWIPASYRRSVVRLVALSEKASLRILDHVIAADPTIAARFPPSKTVIVQNFPRTAEFQSADAPAYGTRAPVVAYVGGVYRMRGVEEMGRAIGRVAPEVDVRLVLAGSLDPASLDRK